MRCRNLLHVINFSSSSDVRTLSEGLLETEKLQWAYLKWYHSPCLVMSLPTSPADTHRSVSPASQVQQPVVSASSWHAQPLPPSQDEIRLYSLLATTFLPYMQRLHIFLLLMCLVFLTWRRLHLLLILRLHLVPPGLLLQILGRYTRKRATGGPMCYRCQGSCCHPGH